jgi:hypothetical protein
VAEQLVWVEVAVLLPGVVLALPGEESPLRWVEAWMPLPAVEEQVQPEAVVLVGQLPVVEEQVQPEAVVLVGLLPAVESDVMAAPQVVVSVVLALLPEVGEELMRLLVVSLAVVWMPVVEVVLREEVFLLPVGAVVRRHRLPRRRICRKSALPA